MNPTLLIRLRLAAVGLCVAFLASCGGPSWNEEADYRWRELRVRGGEAGFQAHDAASLGVDFVNSLDEDERVLNRTLADGSGVAVGDVDGDGLPDLYFGAIDGTNALYLNRGGWRFDDVTEDAGAGLGEHRTTGVVLADVDGDHDLDLVATALGDPTVVLLNDGVGRFTRGAELGAPTGAKTATLADIDGDGDLDLYVTNNKARVAVDLFAPDERSFDRVVIEEGGEYRVADGFVDHYRVERIGQQLNRLELAEADELWINDGAGGFAAASFTDGRFLDEAGVPLGEAPRDWGLSAHFRDLDGDLDQDLYVCNDFETPDRIWLNDGSGNFRAAPFEMVRTTSLACMSVAFADVDGNGHEDFFTADMMSRSARRARTQMAPMANELTAPGQIDQRPQRNRNTLQLARGDGTFAEVANQAGVAASEWTWGSRFVDVDLDGYRDLLVVNGHAWDELDADVKDRTRSVLAGPRWREERRMVPPLELENLAFRNRGDGTFEDVTAAWGFGGDPDVAHGLVSADLDGDGDEDVIATRLDQTPLFFENRSDAPRLAVRLVGDGPNTAAVGATVRLTTPSGEAQRASVAAGDGYLSHSEQLLVFAAPGEGPFSLEVTWPDGAVQEMEAAEANRLYEIRRSPNAAAPGDQPEASTWFVDQTLALGHTHVDEPFDDLARQPMLPLTLSRLGPGLALTDLDDDLDPDLAVASGGGGALQVFLNDGGVFRPSGVQSAVGGLDQGTVLPLPRGRRKDLLVAQSNHQAADRELAESAPAVLRVSGSWARGGRVSAVDAVPGSLDSTGPLALADWDGDGDLDLFVGARSTPTAYPLPTSSRLMLNDGNGSFRSDPDNAGVLEELGLVSGAVFSDLDVDGDPDLVLAVEWGPPMVFRNDGGRFVEATAEFGLARWTGRWIGVATGDFDADGRPDIVATNWGLNTPGRATPEHPLTLYYGDFDRNGTFDVIEAQFDPEVRGMAPRSPLPDLGRGMPAALRGVRDFAHFASMTVTALLGPAAQTARRLEAVTLEHTVFLNREAGFEAVTLPAEAQRAPAFGVVVSDFDADGNEDLFLGQNMFATDRTTSRFDGGRSLVLRGDGSGRFEAVPGTESGIAVYGDVRGVAVGDLDGDARADLVVTQNGAETRVFRNRSTPQGLLVHLTAGGDNPEGIGSRVWIEYADGSVGPTREIQSGSGYWSSSAPAVVLGRRATVAAVHVAWPDGSTSRTPVESDVASVLIRKTGDR